MQILELSVVNLSMLAKFKITLEYGPLHYPKSQLPSISQ